MKIIITIDEKISESDLTQELTYVRAHLIRKGAKNINITTEETPCLNPTSTQI
jgi:hypothetical protein